MQELLQAASTTADPVEFMKNYNAKHRNDELPDAYLKRVEDEKTKQ